MEVILDTNFIISCILKKIDFLFELEGKGFKVLVPREVIQEMKDLRMRGGQSREERAAIDIAFEIFEKKKVKGMSLGGGKVDDGLIKIGKAGAYIATLDNVIKRNVPNRIVILSSKNGIGIERD